MLLDCVIYCAFYSILFRGGGVFSRHGVYVPNTAVLCQKRLNSNCLMASMPGSSSFKIQTNEQGRQLRGNRPKGLWLPLCRPRSRNDINCLVCAERRWRYGQCAYSWLRFSTTAVYCGAESHHVDTCMSEIRIVLSSMLSAAVYSRHAQRTDFKRLIVVFCCRQASMVWRVEEKEGAVRSNKNTNVAKWNRGERRWLGWHICALAPSCADRQWRTLH